MHLLREYGENYLLTCKENKIYFSKLSKNSESNRIYHIIIITSVLRYGTNLNGEGLYKFQASPTYNPGHGLLATT